MSRNGKQRAYKSQSVKSKVNPYPQEEDSIELDEQRRVGSSLQNDTLRKLLAILAVLAQNLLMHLKQVNWRKHAQQVQGGLAYAMKKIPEIVFSSLSAIHESIAPQYRTVTYITTALAVTVLPLALILMWPTGDNLASNSSSYDLPISQQGSALQSESQLAPFFSPSVHYWSDDIVRWSEQTGFDANYLAMIVQLESCGNPLYMQGERMGLFAVPQSEFTVNESFNDADTNARRALQRLEQGMNLTRADLDMTLAYYHGGEIVLQSDFVTWTQEMRDVFIFGRRMYRDAQSGLSQSEVFNQWWAMKGSVLCQQASMTLDMTLSR